MTGILFNKLTFNHTANDPKVFPKIIKVAKFIGFLPASYLLHTWKFGSFFSVGS